MGESERSPAVHRWWWLVCFVAAMALSAVLDLALGVPALVRWVVVVVAVVLALVLVDARSRRR
jgi:hypothetical protein